SKEKSQMRIRQDSTAVSVARAHVEAWSHHDWEKARKSLAADGHVTVTTPPPVMAPTDTIGSDQYMEGLKKFAQGIVPGSVQVISSLGDERNALLMLTVKAAFAPGAPPVTLPAARLYLLDEDNKIKVEQVVFFAAPE